MRINYSLPDPDFLLPLIYDSQKDQFVDGEKKYEDNTQSSWSSSSVMPSLPFPKPVADMLSVPLLPALCRREANAMYIPSESTGLLNGPPLPVTKTSSFPFSVEKKHDASSSILGPLSPLVQPKEIVTKLQKIQVYSTRVQEPTIHQNIGCDGCGMSPVIGVRYKCICCRYALSDEWGKIIFLLLWKFLILPIDRDFDFCGACYENDLSGHTSTSRIVCGVVNERS